MKRYDNKYYEITMEENKKLETDNVLETEEKSSFDFQTIYTILVLNWKWFILSLIICLGAAAIYLRYTTPVYQAFAKLLIKEEDNSRSSRSTLMNATTLGMISNSTGLDNEMEILKSHSIAQQSVRDLKLYVNYYSCGKIKDNLMYKNQPISVDIDPDHLEKLNSQVSLQIQREGNNYHVTGTYYVPTGENTLHLP